MPNLYQPPPCVTAVDELYEHTPLVEYNFNFCFDVPDQLRTGGGVLLKPLVPSLHAAGLIKQFLKFPEMFSYLPYQHTSLSQFLVFLETSRRDSGALLFVAFDLSLQFPVSEGGEQVPEEDERRMAGLLGYIKASPVNRSMELAHLSILPPFHRTHVTSHACSLLLAYGLNPSLPTTAFSGPSSTPLSPLALLSGLSLRRMQWFSNSLNSPSISCALRLGFAHEGSLAWERVLPRGTGVELPAWAVEEERKEGREMDGRDSWVGGLDWVGWREGGGRERVEELVGREVRGREWRA